MKVLPLIGTGALFLLMGSLAPAYAQEDKPKEEAKKEEAKTRKQDEKAPPRQEEKAKPEAQRHEQQVRTEEHAQAVHRTKEEEERQQRAPAIRVSVRTEARIPEARFRANFGVAHVFVIGAPRIVGGYSRFQYGGFWFGFVEPWPEGWYYTDNVYVDYVDGGYFLFNPYYPGVRVAITVVP